ncbi:DUF3027 domain-containing protein [Xanthocytophaga agilis]|uniref:DUF3027 domain-containing protein n=1 Tax=Xanthocytophaga agilis TaxID=3048010 RepID=A0AAE3QXS4_9BACT|nr:DUF3027 domain-containing protein [Xanthocytophaga agilis]MDJ1500036.1 DUF3027 domain-containing protein [Xanthocytophaga agilis]
MSFPVLEVYSQTNDTIENCIVLHTSGNWTKYSLDEFTDVDKIADAHAENCANRWKKTLPPKAFDNHCRDCTYFLPNSGRFYFWDFGLCSNGKSIFDGKVVGVKNSCEYFDDTLNPYKEN